MRSNKHSSNDSCQTVDSELILSWCAPTKALQTAVTKTDSELMRSIKRRPLQAAALSLMWAWLRKYYFSAKPLKPLFQAWSAADDVDKIEIKIKMLWTWCSRSDDVDENKTLQDVIPLLLMIDWCSCCWPQNSSKDGIRRGLMMILMQLFFSTKLWKQAHVIIQTGECLLLEIWERRGSRIQQRASGAAKRIAWKTKDFGSDTEQQKQQQTTPPNRKRQLLQNHHDNRQKRQRQRQRASKQASRH